MNPLIKYLSYEPTSDQQKAIEELSSFLPRNNGRDAFVLRGYAGTGKTSLVKSIVKALPTFGLRFHLMAPTGRAAKVLSRYTGQPAFTIHRSIYFQKNTPEGGLRFELGENRRKHTLFVVDEASMISSESNLDGRGDLLSDLLEYIFSGEGCKVLFLGDLGQLPPVGALLSKALSDKVLTSSYGLDTKLVDMREVVRQQAESGILYNATLLRLNLAEKNHHPKFELKDYTDVSWIPGLELAETLEDVYGRYDMKDIVTLCRSNKSANRFNQEIRRRILWKENELEAGDLLMVVKNNYHWTKDEESMPFIANGDAAEVEKIIREEEAHGFRFADVMLRFVDYPETPAMEVKIMMDTLHVNGPQLPQGQYRQLVERVAEGYLARGGGGKTKMKSDPYINALQVKFSYAVTCHKAQGGQWPAVFIEQGYLTDDMMGQEFIRWLYTAVTRATEKLFLVNFREDFLAS